MTPRARYTSCERVPRRSARGKLEPDAADGQRSAISTVAGSTRRPEGRGTRLPGASCAAGRSTRRAHHCAGAFRAGGASRGIRSSESHCHVHLGRIPASSFKTFPKNNGLVRQLDEAEEFHTPGKGGCALRKRIILML